METAVKKPKPKWTKRDIALYNKLPLYLLKLETRIKSTRKEAITKFFKSQS